METVTYVVSGMTCSHCVGAVEGEVRRIPGVREVEVRLEEGVLVVVSEGPVGEAVVAAAVDEAGYELVGAS